MRKSSSGWRTLPWSGWNIFLNFYLLVVRPTSAFRMPENLPSFVHNIFPYRKSRCYLIQQSGFARALECSSSGTRFGGTNLHLSSAADDDFVEASDLEAIQGLFSKYCDNDGLMPKTSTMQLPAISQLLADGDLLTEEFNDIWNKAPKFPDLQSEVERIDVDSFVQIYRDIDDLFEEDEETIEQPATGAAEAKAASNDADDQEDPSLEAELESIFESICDDAGLISKERLREWDEVRKLMEEGLLDDSEFDDVWEQTQKSPGSPELLDVDAFLSFNVALDGLFDFSDDEEDEVLDAGPSLDQSTEVSQQSVDTSISTMVDDEELSAGDLFDALANQNGLVGKTELARWSSLQEMLADGDLLPSELDSMYESAEKSSKSANLLDKDAFVALYNAIDDLFEEDDGGVKEILASTGKKQILLSALEALNSDTERLPCGLESTDTEQSYVLDLVNSLSAEATNMVQQKQGAIEPSDMSGTWDLLYSSSSTMRYNKGLSGLADRVPGGKFSRLTQKLVADSFLSDVEYLETIKATPEAASLEVRVTGDWELRTSVSLFTGQPSIVLTVTPGLVYYGPATTKGDHWKSLGPMNMLDVAYLDEDLRIMRGSTSGDTIFVFRRIS